MLQNYARQLLVFAFILLSFTALGQSFGTSVSARYGDGCRLDFYNTTNVKIFSLRGSELRYWYNPSGQIIVRDENTQVTDLFGITGLAALIDSVQSVCLAGVCGSSTPIETFTYCGVPVANYFGAYDTINSPIAYDDFKGLATFQIPSDTTQTGFAMCSNDLYEPTGSDFTLYPHNKKPNLGCEASNYIPNLLPDFENCDSVKLFIFEMSPIVFIPDSYYQIGYPPLPLLFDTISVDYNIKEVNTSLINIGNDTLVIKDFAQFFIVPASKKVRLKRNLGVSINSIALDTSSATITIEAKPVKTSGQTYASSSFKIEKIAFADITAGTISGSSYNPNSGTQTDTFALTTGKNTFKVSVEDTDGNIVYSIFQVTKTAL